VLRALRHTLPRQQAWWAAVPALRVLQKPGPRATFTAGQVAELYRLLRMLWLAEMVFGDKSLAHDWLVRPKVRLYGAMPVQQAQDPRQASQVERWLIDIDEGNGP